MKSSDCQEWGLPVQQEYDSESAPTRTFAYDFSDFRDRKVYGNDLESFVITSNGKVFVISSELGGNVWQGFVGIYNSWSDAESSLSTPIAYFVDNSTTFSCAVRLNDSAIACGADKGTVELLRFTAGDNFPDVRIYNTLAGHDDVVSSMGVTLDNTHVISGSFDRTVKSWDLDNGTCVSTSNAFSDKILATATSPVDANIYCAACRNGSLQLLDSRLCSGVAPSVLKSPACSLLSAGAYPTTIAWSEALSQCIYAGYSDGSLVCFDLKKSASQNGGMNVPESYMCRPHVGAITSIDVSPENSLVVVSGGEDGSVCVEDFSLQSERRFALAGKHASFVRHVKWFREGSVCSAGWDGKLRLFSKAGKMI